MRNLWYSSASCPKIYADLLEELPAVLAEPTAALPNEIAPEFRRNYFMPPCGTARVGPGSLEITLSTYPTNRALRNTVNVSQEFLIALNVSSIKSTKPTDVPTHIENFKLPYRKSEVFKPIPC